ncbi:MAG: hypothetical protein CVU16_09000 [Betaproteobacteria bacterium HGW-Betaproteobacteria-10]|nr:MAG: hypothetical protein CVU16_09000 [Betaproteobacteria bacterium HGW-Betaproteobacteria-10]
MKFLFEWLVTRNLESPAHLRTTSETLIYSKPFGLSLSKPLKIRVFSFDKLKANGINQCLPSD